MSVFLSLLYSELRYSVPLLIAGCLFMPFFPKRSHFIIRCIISFTIYIAIDCVISYFRPYLKIEWFSFSFAMTFVVMLFALFFCLKTSFKNILFFGMAAYAIQNSVDNITNLIIPWYPNVYLGTNHTLFWPIYALVLISVYTIGYFLFFRKTKNRNADNINGKIFYLVLFTTLFVVYILSMYATLTNGVAEQMSIRIYAIVCCILLLSIQFGIFEKSAIEEQNAILYQILHKEKEQHRRLKENIESINIKTHDIKHQISAIRQYANSKEANEYLDDLEKSVTSFGNYAKTGNETLDIILTEKSFYCEQHNIKFSCIVDGSKLGFMKSTDIYSLFGNALDNAIEAVKDIDDVEKRTITINVREVSGVLGIHFDNYCNNNVRFVNSLPQTTKNNTQTHGYGVRSIQYIVYKYKGTLAFKLENNIFTLNITFPL